MFKQSEPGFGGTSGTAVLSMDAAIAPARPANTMRQPLKGWRTRLHDIDLVPDLGARIGSLEWMRGVVTCGGLCAAAITLSPGFERPLPGAVPAPLAPAAWDEVRAQSFAPLAFGGDSGRHMAATDAVRPLADTPERPMIELSATLGQGDGFARVLERAGVGRTDAKLVADMASRAVTLGAIRPGTRMDMVLGRRPARAQPRPLDKLAFRAAFDLRLEFERAGGRLAMRRVPIAVDDTPLRIQGRAGSSLYAAARAAGAPASAVEAYVREIKRRVPLGSIGGDSRFDIIVAHRRAATGETEVGELLFAGLDQGKRKTRLVKWTSGGRSEFFEASGVGEQRGVMARPVNGRQTSGFGMRRHPLLGYSRFHRGMDFGAAYGTPIYAATDGTVTFAGRHGGHGNYVMLKHGGGIATAYAHMSRIGVRYGQKVNRGQVIGYVGSTGLSTGPHLHYEVYRNGTPINPKTMSFTTQAQLVGQDLRNFKARLNTLLAVRPGAARIPAVARAEDGENAAD
ncbi:peptidoglycan DD-metalloendopeptidase family protein [Sphingomonas sanxanigenens]|uniref:M23 family metallopeptidase n=1 Tax=Sphingomonas sanxanigenens TaxID=397260 RepID=UPI00046D451C